MTEGEFYLTAAGGRLDYRYGGYANRETTMDAKTAMRKIMPAGTFHGEESSVWRKNGGYADTTIKRLLVKARAAGFTQAEWKPGGNADGSVVGSGTTYVHPAGHTLHISSFYGVNARGNTHRIGLRLK